MRILILKTSAFGDVVQTLFIATLLKKHFPKAQVDWLIEKRFSKLVKAHPKVDRVFDADTKKWRRSLLKKETRLEIKLLRKALHEHTYDIVFDLQGNIKSSLLGLLVKTKEKVGFGKKSVSEWPNLLFTSKKIDVNPNNPVRKRLLSFIQSYFKDESFELNEEIDLMVSEDEKEVCDEFFAQSCFQGKKRLLIAPASAWEVKKLSEETWIDFLGTISQEGNWSFVWVWGSEDERELAQRLYRRFPSSSQLAPSLSCSGLQYLINRADGLIGMDSFALHLCGTTKTPSLGIFGPTKLEMFNPMSPIHKGFQASCPFDEEFTKWCRHRRTCKGPCLKKVDPKGLVDAFQRAFE